MGPPIGRDIRSGNSFTVVALFVVRKEGGRPYRGYPLSGWTYGIMDPTVAFRFTT